jgi:hypothetical protein
VTARVGVQDVGQTFEPATERSSLVCAEDGDLARWYPNHDLGGSRTGPGRDLTSSPQGVGAAEQVLPLGTVIRLVCAHINSLFAGDRWTAPEAGGLGLRHPSLAPYPPFCAFPGRGNER